MSDNDDRYTGDLGELDGIDEIVPDFLPPPEVLAKAPVIVKVTIGLSQESLTFFRQKAEELHVPYQRMIRTLLDEYARRYAK